MKCLHFFIKAFTLIFILSQVYACDKNDDKPKDPPISGGISKSEISGEKIIVTDFEGNRSEYNIYGFCYSVDPAGKKFQESFEWDLNLLKTVQANSIRTYRPLAAYKSDGSIDYPKTKEMLDALAKAGISISMGFDLNQDLLTGLYKTYLDEFGSHAALLSVLFGNEYNYHYIGSTPGWAEEWFTKASWLANLKEAVTQIKARCNRFVTVVHGEIPTPQEITEYEECGIDLIMLNIYRGESFYDLFDQWSIRTAGTMPLVVSEFGRSSVTANGADAGITQRDWLNNLWNEIDDKLCSHCAGGYIFQLVDEAWKSGANDLTGSEKDFGVFKEDGAEKPAAGLLKKLWVDKKNCQ